MTEPTSPPTPPTLSELEARILGVLVEKQATVPDTYPLSLNALVAGCNQKTSRDPLMNASDAEAQAALDSLRSRSLIVESSGSRVTRYAHNVGKVLQVPSAAVALLATLFLRGPQTSAELRANCERLHRFADIHALEALLAELAERRDPLVMELARRPGTRENRWMHLLCGSVATGDGSADDALATHPPRGAGLAASHDDTMAALELRISRLEDELATLREQLSRAGTVAAAPSEN